MTQYSPGIVAHSQSASPAPSRLWIESIGLAIALGIAYFLAARLSLYLILPDGVAVFWPAAGVSAGVLIGLGPRARWPVVAGTMVATVVANLLGDRNIWSTLVFALCNAVEPLIVAILIERFFGPSFNLERPRNVIALVAAAIAGTAISGIGGALGFKLFYNTSASFLTIWHHWFASDAFGIITVAPLLIGVVAVIRDPPPLNEAIEGSVVVAIVTVVSGLIVLLPRELWVAVVPPASIFPLLLWITARCRPVFAAAAAFVIALAVVWTTTFGIGILGDPHLLVDHRILSAQAGILTASLCALILAALFAERRANEAHLSHSKMMLERERDNKLMNMQAVTASMAHELKQPLTAISANGEAAQLFLNQMQPNLEQAQSALDSIIADSHRASHIINDIRALFTRADKSHEPTDVNEITFQALRILREQLNAHGVRTDLELATDLPLVMGHKGQLQEVMINLFQNAIEAMNDTKDGRRVMQVKSQWQGDDAIVVGIKDSGPGINPARLNSVFEAFFTTKSHGTGLGLAICRMIIERHGGQLSASSDGRNGALFQFVIPVRGSAAGDT
jgi:signal transduction histidine kinase